MKNNNNEYVNASSQNNMCCDRCGSTTYYNNVQHSLLFIEKGYVYTTLCFDYYKSLTDAIDDS